MLETTASAMANPSQLESKDIEIEKLKHALRVADAFFSASHQQGNLVYESKHVSAADLVRKALQ